MQDFSLRLFVRFFVYPFAFSALFMWSLEENQSFNIQYVRRGTQPSVEEKVYLVLGSQGESMLNGIEGP